MNSPSSVDTNSSFRLIFWLAVIFALLTGLIFIFSPLIVPLLIAFSLYAICEPVHALLLRKGLSDKTSASVIVLVLCISISVIFTVLASPVSTQFQLLLERLPVIMDTLTTVSKEFFESNNLPAAEQTLLTALNSFQPKIGEFALTQGSGLMLSLVSILVLVPLITFFLIKDYKRFRSWSLSRLPNASFELGWIIYSRVVDKLQHYIRGIFVQSVVVAVVCSTGFYLAGFDSYILLGVMAGIFNIIPYVGPLLSLILPVLIVLSEIPLDAMMLVFAVTVILVAQLIDNVFVIPLVIASSVNLHPLVVILGLIIFGNAFGLIGMVLAVPVMVTINIIYSGLRSGLYVNGAS